MHKHFGVWKTTIIGGVFFLLPFAVVMFLLGEIASIVYAIAKKIGELSPQSEKWSFGGVSLAFVLAIGVLLALCYLAGLAARRSVGVGFAEKIERNLQLLFPRYGVLKKQLASNFGGQDGGPPMKPVLVKFADVFRIGFEMERGAGDLVTIYLPGSPDTWLGHVVHVRPEQIEPIAGDFAAAVAVSESLGRDAARALNGAPLPLSPR